MRSPTGLMSTAIQITTGCRLHFGPLAVGATTGRAFGGLGLMLDEPGIRLTAMPGEQDRYAGSAEHAECVSEALRGVRERTGSLAAAGLEVTLHSAIPRHLGLGSGTQLALATAQAALGPTLVPAVRLARYAGRGARSAIGIHGFEQGGLLVDAGKRAADAVGTLAARVAFPSDWPILLWTPRDGRGLSGADERRAFNRLAPMPASLTDRLCGFVLRELLPSLGDRVWEEFCGGLREYGRLVGEYFAPIQGGLWADAHAPQIVDWLRRRGVMGVAQSSWGPTLAAVLPEQSVAEDLVRQWPFDRGEVQLTQARNHGAEVVPAAGE